METVIIIGAGASGLACASTLSRLDNNINIIILEQFSKSGKKILASGNGRCNISNKQMDITSYNTNDTRIENIIQNFNPERYFASIGMLTCWQGNLLYPYSNQALTVKNSLLTSLQQVSIIEDCKALEIQKDNRYTVITNKGKFEADYVVIATGSKANGLSGQDNYEIVKKLNIDITPLYPSLVQLKTKPVYKELKGVRAKCQVFLVMENEVLGKEQGEILFTDQGVSGICIFQLSRKYPRNTKKPVHIEIDFMSEITNEDMQHLLHERLKQHGSYYLEGILNNKLATVLTKEKISPKHFSLEVIGTEDDKKAQVISGGVDLKEINQDFELHKYPNIFVIGEVLDVDGDCGGYNLHFAFGSGDYVAKKINDRMNKNA